MHWLQKIGVALLALVLVSGCANRDNLSPFQQRAQMRQQLQNQNGKIGDLETMNNAVKNQLSELKASADVQARDIQAMQQGSGNKSNSGVQLFQGDGAMIVILFLGLGGMALAGGILYYRGKAVKSDKTAQILAQQLAAVDDDELHEKICMAALNSEVESEVYRLLVKNRLMRK